MKELKQFKQELVDYYKVNIRTYKLDSTLVGYIRTEYGERIPAKFFIFEGQRYGILEPDPNDELRKVLQLRPHSELFDSVLTANIVDSLTKIEASLYVEILDTRFLIIILVNQLGSIVLDPTAKTISGLDPKYFYDRVIEHPNERNTWRDLFKYLDLEGYSHSESSRDVDIWLDL